MNFRLSILLINGLLAAALALLPACARTPDVLKIGLVAPFEGAERALGYDAIYAARLAIRQVNEGGGFGRYRVALVALDDGGRPELAERSARSLVLDPVLVAVIGHGLPETTAAAAPIYQQNDLPLIPLGAPDWPPFAPASLPSDFTRAYEAVTPFDERPGLFAAPTYDAMQLLFAAMRQLASDGQVIDRQTLASTLSKVTHQGITGTVSYTP